MNELELLQSWPAGFDVSPSPEARAHALAQLEAQYIGRVSGIRPRFVKRLAVATLAMVVLVVGALVWANREADDRFARLKTVTVPSGALGGGEIGQAPVNILLVGSDSRAFVQSGADVAAFGSATDAPGQRADTMILLRITGDSVQGVWIPRDLAVGGTKINSTFDRGAGALIAAIKTTLGVTVDHYVEVDFQGFRGLVDQLGGVPVATPGHVRDVYSGVDLPAGCVRLDGTQALSWVRSRHLQIEQNGVWRDASPNADLDRLARQQEFLRSLGARARAQVGDDPVAAVRLADRLLPAMKVDSRFTRAEVVRLVRALVGLDRSALQFSTLPVQATAEYNFSLAQPTADQALAGLRGGPSPAAPPAPAPGPSC